MLLQIVSMLAKCALVFEKRIGNTPSSAGWLDVLLLLNFSSQKSAGARKHSVFCLSDHKIARCHL